MATGSITGLATATLTKNDSGGVIVAEYTKKVYRIGHLKVLSLSVQFTLPAQNVWRTIYTIPTGFEAANACEMNVNNSGNTVCIRVSGNVVQVSNPSGLAATSRTFALTFPYI